MNINCNRSSPRPLFGRQSQPAWLARIVWGLLLLCTVGMSAAQSVTPAVPVGIATLNVNTTGTGSGTISSSPAGIDCGTACSKSYDTGTRVTLTATPAEGSSFTGWSGDCSGSADCVVGMSREQSVSAGFTPSKALSLTVAGAGAGTVNSSPSGVNCSASCSSSFVDGTSVTLSATAAVGSTFAGWSGDCSGARDCTLSLTEARAVTATFAFSSARNLLSVATAGAGAGAVVGEPSGIDCGSICSASYTSGTSVTLTARPAAGNNFTGWSGACSGSGACVVSLTQARRVTASFSRAYTLGVSKTGIGAGTVNSSPLGIDCGATCSFSFDSGTSVTLTAQPVPGSSFTGWSGACSGAAACTLGMSQNQNVTATFAVGPAKRSSLPAQQQPGAGDRVMLASHGN